MQLCQIRCLCIPKTHRSLQGLLYIRSPQLLAVRLGENQAGNDGIPTQLDYTLQPPFLRLGGTIGRMDTQGQSILPKIPQRFCPLKYGRRL